MGQQIRILLIDDHSLFRDSLSRLLESDPGFAIAGSCGTVRDALAVLEGDTVDVVLLDFDLGTEQAPAFLDAVKARGYRARVLMVTAGMSDGDTLSAFEKGCAGIFLKHSPPPRLIDAIHQLAAGEMWLDSGAVRSLVAGASGRSGEGQNSGALTTRERAVLKGVFEGLTNKEIGGNLEISESSVKAVLQQLFTKTGVRTRSQLVRFALERHAQDWLKERPA